jgi:UDP-N-acetylmuramoyl-L-alanyl-D-glutamate--2,6-diaminopimelate ligase
VNPSSSLAVAGITGTNGKTTTSYLVKSVLQAWGKKVGLIGTIQYMIGEEIFAAAHTTPESLEFQHLLSRMRAGGCSHVVTEVSSHALAQKRVDCTTFRTAVFTNLTRDHLDFHKTMEEYYRAKGRLFTELLAAGGQPIVNQDDPYGRRLSDDLRQDGRDVRTYGLEAGADLLARDISTSFAGLEFRIVAEGGQYDVASPLVGLPNVYNILSAAGASRALGVPWENIIEGIRTSGDVKGRFEKVEAGQGFLAVVDFAHTEDALERLIYTAKGLTKGRVITVFGCGGNRDRGKRSRMGAIATKLSDLVVITSDNPRSEEPIEIIKEIEDGAVRRNYITEPDREEAIRRAVLIAGENDIVLVAGKGHEQYQEIDGRRLAFNDREVLEKSIRQLIANK